MLFPVLTSGLVISKSEHGVMVPWLSNPPILTVELDPVITEEDQVGPDRTTICNPTGFFDQASKRSSELKQ